MRLLLFAAFGIAMEVVFTAVTSPSKNLFGRSTLWMIPVYAAASPAFHFFNLIFIDANAAVRLIAYILGIWLFELVYGIMLRFLLGKAPWEDAYHGKSDTVFGLIRLAYAPGWALAGYLFSRLDLYLSNLH